jgi:hypothetical protein
MNQLRDWLEGRPNDPDEVRRLILASGEVARYHDPAGAYLHPEEINIALDVDLQFAISVNFEDGRPDRPPGENGRQPAGCTVNSRRSFRLDDIPMTTPSRGSSPPIILDDGLPEAPKSMNFGDILGHDHQGTPIPPERRC